MAGVPGNPLQPQQQQQSVIKPDLSYPDYILKRVQVARNYGCEYQLDDYDIKRIQFDRYKQTFKDTLTRNITMLRRIRHRKMGESNFSEWLAYYVTDSIWDDAHQEHQWQEWLGVDQEPVPQVKYNALREVESINFDQKRVVYTIPWSKEAVDAALEHSLIVPTDLAIGYAPTMGTKDIWAGSELSVHNLQELTEFPFETLERANQGGYLRKEYGGVKDMLREESDEANREKELGPNMFDRMPTIQQMKEEIKRREALEARKRKEQQKDSRERQIEVQAVQEAEHQKES